MEKEKMNYDYELVKDFEKRRKAYIERSKEVSAIRDERIKRKGLWETNYGDRDRLPHWKKEEIIPQELEISIKLSLKEQVIDKESIYSAVLMVNKFKNLVFYFIKAYNWGIHVNIRNNPRENEVVYFMNNERILYINMNSLDNVGVFVKYHLELLRNKGYDLMSKKLPKNWVNEGAGIEAKL